MRGVNKVLLIGNATRHAEVRQTKSGKLVAGVRLATNRRVGAQEDTQYHTIVCWDTLAETVARSVKKGDALYVEGRLQYRTFTDDVGTERSVAEVVASDVQFLSRRNDATAAPARMADDVPLEDLTLEEVLV